MAEDPLVGTVLGPCRLERLIGAGGMGRVYKARHLALDRDVAVKLVDRAASADKAAREAAFAEARAAAKLEDPRIVAVYEVGEDRGVGYIVMQWVDGESLESRVRREGPLSNERALAVARDMAGALAAAHAAGIVHRDVKPANVLLDARGGAKLTDFGLAAGAGRIDAGGESVGSFHFMAPEQGWGAPPDPRMDVYALGGTWFFALTGAAPFSGAPGDIVVAHREAPPPDARRLRPDVTSRASALIRRLLDKNPDRRPLDGAALTKELSDSGLLLEVDASGSPLSLLAPAEPASVPGEIAAQPSPQRYVPPPPPPAPAAPALGSRAAFQAILVTLCATAAVWPWRRAVAEDWLAAGVIGAGAPLLLGIGARFSTARRALGAALWLGSVACAAEFILRRGRGDPGLETLIAAAFGLLASGGSAYLAYWGADREELLWARFLAPAGAVLTASAALAWAAPDSPDWSSALHAEASGTWRILMDTGGGWRWGGLVAFAVALLATRGLRTTAQDKPKDRRLNWTN